MIKAGLLGCGNLAKVIARFAKKFDVEIVALYDFDFEKAKKLEEISGKACKSFEEFLSENFDFVVEAASAEAVREFGEKILESGKNLVVLSVSALADKDLLEKLKRVAKKSGKRVFIPSGAIVGVDGVLALKFFNPKVKLVTSKSPESLGTDKEGLIFKGSSREAAKKFPKNLNVAATLFLAAGKEVDVEVYSKRGLKTNVHEIFVEWDFGRFYVSVENVPSEENPKSSYLAAFSVLSLLKNLEEEVVVW